MTRGHHWRRVPNKIFFQILGTEIYCSKIAISWLFRFSIGLTLKIWKYLLRGACDKFPDFFRMGI